MAGPARFLIWIKFGRRAPPNKSGLQPCPGLAWNALRHEMALARRQLDIYQFWGRRCAEKKGKTR
jgi:hypothetical protein